jgi:hypothetical protein
MAVLDGYGVGWKGLTGPVWQGGATRVCGRIGMVWRGEGWPVGLGIGWRGKAWHGPAGGVRHG